MSDENFYKNYYRGHAVRFDSTRLWGDEEVEQTALAISNYMPRDGNLVEIGCGSFKHGALLASAGFKVIGIDFTMEQLNQAPPRSVVLCADVRSIPLRTSSIGGIIGIMMLHQVAPSERQSVTTEVKRVLRPGGMLVIKSCTHDDLRKRPLSRWFPSSLKINLARFPPDSELRTLLSGSGLNIIRVWSTESHSIFPKDLLIDMLTTRPSSSLRLVPEDEYISGLERFRNQHANRSLVRLSHYHTYYLARRE